MAGGSGTRLWPLSRAGYRKQFLVLQGNESLLQQAAQRLAALGGAAPPIVVGNEEHRFLILDQLREARCTPAAVVLEPAGRNTAPAVTLAALQATHGGADPVLVIGTCQGGGHAGYAASAVLCELGRDRVLPIASRSRFEASVSIGSQLRGWRASKVPLVALVALVYVGIAFTGRVLGGSRRCDQRGVHDRASLEHQALELQQFVDGCKNLIGQLVLLQQITKQQDRGLIRQPITQARTCKLPKQRHVVRRLSHSRGTQREPMLHEVDAQHGQHREWRTACLALTGVGRHHRHQISPRHHAVHLGQKLTLAPGAQVQARVSLSHGSDRHFNFSPRQARLPGGFKALPWVPPGFAHGFLTLSETAEFLYKATDYCVPQHQRSIVWNDSGIGIQWPRGPTPLLSDKRNRGLALARAEVFG
jgi:hypothetical protein